jgi:hypothetical protein
LSRWVCQKIAEEGEEAFVVKQLFIPRLFTKPQGGTAPKLNCALSREDVSKLNDDKFAAQALAAASRNDMQKKKLADAREQLEFLQTKQTVQIQRKITEAMDRDASLVDDAVMAKVATGAVIGDRARQFLMDRRQQNARANAQSLALAWGEEEEPPVKKGRVEDKE